MRVLVLGAAGMLGHKVCQVLGRTKHEVAGTLRDDVNAHPAYRDLYREMTLLEKVDVLDDESLERAIRSVEPEFVVNCIGIVKQLPEAEDPFLSVAINSFLPHRLARLCQQRNCRLIHISTDCVFDGSKGNYLETDLTNAEDLYGRSKALGETQSSQTSALTLRTSFIGRELKASTHGLIEWFLTQGGQRVQGFAGVTYTGLTSLELAAVIGCIVDGGIELNGTRQVASEPINKYQLLCLVRDVYGLDIEIDQVTEPTFERSLIMSSFSEVMGYSAPSWKQMIVDMHQDPTPYNVWAR